MTAIPADDAALAVDIAEGARRVRGATVRFRGEQARPHRSRYRRGIHSVLLPRASWFITPTRYNRPVQATLAPSGAHPLGTNEVGYDQLGRLMAGGQSSLEVGVAAALLATAFGTLWGAIAGYAGGFIDSAMMRIVDALLAVPALFLVLFLASIERPTVGLLILVIAFISWLGPARSVRGQALTLRTRDYVTSVTADGWRPVARDPPPHRAERHRHRGGERDLPGGGRDLDRGRAELPRPRHTAAGRELGACSLTASTTPTTATGG